MVIISFVARVVNWLTDNSYACFSLHLVILRSVSYLVDSLLLVYMPFQEIGAQG